MVYESVRNAMHADACARMTGCCDEFTDRAAESSEDGIVLDRHDGREPLQQIPEQIL